MVQQTYMHLIRDVNVFIKDNKVLKQTYQKSQLTPTKSDVINLSNYKISHILLQINIIRQENDISDFVTISFPSRRT